MSDKQAFQQKILTQFQALVEVVQQLRGPSGCPWDKEQDQRTLTQYAIEEAYELAEAIESGNQTDVKEELGDFLFQVVLQAQVAQDEGKFDLAEVIEILVEKLVRRHPHVFADTKVSSVSDVWKNWERLKAEEKSGRPKPIFSYPRKMPALQASHKIGVKSQGYAFDWTHANEVWEKVKEEVSELEAEIPSKNLQALEHEIGDVLFSVSQLARHLGLEAEQCLRSANRRFEDRFSKVLVRAGEEFGPEFQEKEKFSSLPAEEKEKLWQEIKLIKN